MRARWLPFTSAMAGVLLAGSPGVRPTRATVADYPAHQAAGSFTIGAALISRSDVRKIFAADLNHAGYIVVEVGLFPLPGKDVDLSPGDFMLLTDGGKVATRTVDSDAIAGVIGRDHSSSPPKSSDVYSTTGVSVSRIPVVDPSTGRQTHTTVIGTEENVSNGPPVGYPAPTTGPNTGAIEQELWAKSLPDGLTSVPVAGYLYFPKPSGKTSGAWELMMDGAAGRVKLTLQDPAKR